MSSKRLQNGGSDLGIVMTFLGIAAVVSAVLLAQAAFKGCKEDRMRGSGPAEPTPRYPIERIETVEVRPESDAELIPTASPTGSPQSKQ